VRFKRLVRRTHLARGQLDIAPLVDVMFLLLIFFMLTSNFILQPGIQVRLPRAITSEVIYSDNLVISVTSQDLMYLNKKPIQMSDLLKTLKTASREGSSILIKADVGASLGRIVELWDLCRELGISRVNIATNQKRSGPS
jgi:biopolymer transport protein ExbD